MVRCVAMMRPSSRDLLIAGAVQFLALLFAASILDMGQWAQATGDISVGYWVGIAIVIVRRSNSLTAGDHVYVRFGLVPLLMVGVPVTLGIWAYRGLM